MLQCAALDSSIFASELQRSLRVSLEAARFNERHVHVKAVAVRGELQTPAKSCDCNACARGNKCVMIVQRADRLGIYGGGFTVMFSVMAVVKVMIIVMVMMCDGCREAAAESKTVTKRSSVSIKPMQPQSQAATSKPPKPKRARLTQGLPNSRWRRAPEAAAQSTRCFDIQHD